MNELSAEPLMVALAVVMATELGEQATLRAPRRRRAWHCRLDRGYVGKDFIFATAPDPDDYTPQFKPPITLPCEGGNNGIHIPTDPRPTTAKPWGSLGADVAILPRSRAGTSRGTPNRHFRS